MPTGRVSRWLRRRAFAVSPVEASCSRRGFRVEDPAVRDRLDSIGGWFVGGYNAALTDPRPGPLAECLDGCAAEARGFAYEGAAMALTLLDRLTPWHRRRLAVFLDGPGRPYAYLVHVGAGWALARLRRDLDAALPRFDPTMRWLVADGFGFHSGFFHPALFVAAKSYPDRVSGYARRAFDQGLGRSLWFVEGADPDRIEKTIAGFDVVRRDDLWSGIGLACAYAGGVDEHGLAQLVTLAGERLGWLAQGAAFAAAARQRAGNPAAHTDLACRTVFGRSADEAAECAHRLRDAIPAPGVRDDGSTYDRWRHDLRAALRAEVVR